MSKYLIKFIVIILLVFSSSCFKDVIDNEISKVSSNEIDEIVSYLDLKSYPTTIQTTEIPIVGWHGIQEGNLNKSRFEEAQEAGININYTHHTHIDSVQKSLDIAKDLGMKILIFCPELIKDPINTVLRFMDHPANGGYFIIDEPVASSISTYKPLVRTIESIDSTHFCYINLLPNQFSATDLGTIDYKQYINRYIIEIPLKVLSFDHYPVINTSISPVWYENLEIIREEANKNNIPFWAFGLTTSHLEYPVPNLNHLRLQVYSNLLYGAKGIQYFTYWTLKSKRWDFNSGPIDVSGKRTEVFYYLQKINEEIQILSSIFLSSRVTKISHFGQIPKGTIEFDNPPYFIKSININGGNALVSEMENTENRFFIIQNSNLNKEIEIDIQTDSYTKIILKSGTIIPATLINERFKLIPGDIVIFMR
ncbi:MAG: hypothetical protein PHE29_00660 [Tissierellia bacterium]|nr:hypothetical protein [Tissierellia bacterium]